MKNIFEIPEIDPVFVDRIKEAHRRLDAAKTRLDLLQEKKEEFKSRRAVVAGKIKDGKESLEKAQQTLFDLTRRQKEEHEPEVKSARTAFNNALSLLKESHRDLERFDSVERAELEKETESVKGQYAEAENNLWKAVHEVEMLRFAELARQIVHRLYASKIKNLPPGSSKAAFEKFAVELLGFNGARTDAVDILHEYVRTTPSDKNEQNPPELN